MVKLNLGALKESSLEKKKKNLDNNNVEEKENIDKKSTEEVVPIYQKEQKDPVNKIMTDKVSTQKVENNKKIDDLPKDKEIVQEKEEDSNCEIFSNYESDFTKKKQTIMQSFKKAKDYVKPKTRLGFVFMLLFITFTGIGLLFIIAPEVHNINNYKVNILKIKCKISDKNCSIEEKQIKKKTGEIKIKKEKKPKILIEDKIINKSGISIKYQIETKGMHKMFILNNSKYNEKEFKQEIEKIIESNQKEKLKKYLQNKGKKDLIKFLKKEK